MNGIRILAVVAAAVSFSSFAGVDWYVVDPMSERPYLPGEAPKDGEKGGDLRIVAARGEYEPCSFVLVSDADLGKVSIDISDLKREQGTGNGEQGDEVFPKENLDLKNVKVWYQCGNAWYSYFGDTGLVLCPELLLNDEDLVKVDEQKGCNYARRTEKDGSVSYRWLNPPAAVDTRLEDVTRMGKWLSVSGSFDCMKENFSDAPTYRGVTLAKGVHKQVFLTAHVTTNQAAGLYRGEVRVQGRGHQWSIPISLRVLDFTLPEPCCYYDCHKPFGVRFHQYISLDHILSVNGNDRALAERQMVAILSDFVRHGDTNPCYLDRHEHPEWARQAGQSFANPHYNGDKMELDEKVEMRYRARRMKERMTRIAGGWYRPFLTWNNEYTLHDFRGIRDAGMVRIYKEAGFRFACETRSGYDGDTHLFDRWWPPLAPDQENVEKGATLNHMGVDFAWYAVQHIGAENPAFNRRQCGFGAYRAGFTINENYAHHLGGWNDLTDGYKPMMFVYGTGNGCVDTLAWEGFREGLDYIRYATLLLRLAQPLLQDESPAVREPARKAVKLLATATGDDMDLTTLRLEMIGHIEALKGLGVR